MTAGVIQFSGRATTTLRALAPAIDQAVSDWDRETDLAEMLAAVIDLCREKSRARTNRRR